MPDIELPLARRAAEPARKHRSVLLGEGATHHGIGGRVLAQRHDRVAHAGILDDIAARRGARDRIGIGAVAECRPGLLQGREPGLIDELEQPGCGRGPHGQVRVEIGFDLGRGEQIVEARPRRFGGLTDGAGNGIRADGRGGVDRHGFWPFVRRNVNEYGKRNVNAFPQWEKPYGSRFRSGHPCPPQARRPLLRRFRGRPPLRASAHPNGDADGQHVVLQHDPQSAAAAHRPALLRAGDRMGPAADELPVHARPHDRHHGQ